MKKRFLVMFLACFIIFLTSCGEFGRHKEKYNIGDIPPEVVRVHSLPSSYPVRVITAYPNTFEDFEKEVTESSQGKVIFECEMVEGGTLIKSFKNNNEHNLGNYRSFVLTPVRITKIHFQDDDCEITVKVGDVVYVTENYFWVTSDMEEVLEEYDEGTYLTISEYYPMMLGEKYVVYAEAGELDDYGVNSEKPVMYPHRGKAVYCISENVIHTRRQKVYDLIDEIYQTGAWLKYSGKTEFKHEYADIFGEEKNVIKVSHVDKTPITTYRSFEEKKEAFKANDNGYGVIIKVSLKEKGNQVPAPDIDYLSDYDYCTVSNVEIDTVLYTGEKSSGCIEFNDVLKVYEPYYNQDGEYITHSRYIPLDIAKGKPDELLLFGYLQEINGEKVLIADNQGAVYLNGAVDSENTQIILGPEGYLCYLEARYAVSRGNRYTEW